MPDDRSDPLPPTVSLSHLHKIGSKLSYQFISLHSIFSMVEYQDS